MRYEQEALYIVIWQLVNRWSIGQLWSISVVLVLIFLVVVVVEADVVFERELMRGDISVKASRACEHNTSGRGENDETRLWRSFRTARASEIWVVHFST